MQIVSSEGVGGGGDGGGGGGVVVGGRGDGVGGVGKYHQFLVCWRWELTWYNHLLH